MIYFDEMIPIIAISLLLFSFLSNNVMPSVVYSLCLALYFMSSVSNRKQDVIQLETCTYTAVILHDVGTWHHYHMRKDLDFGDG